MENNLKEVYFDEYCESCICKNTPENEDPCCECLACGATSYSHKPTNYKEDTSNADYKKKS